MAAVRSILTVCLMGALACGVAAVGAAQPRDEAGSVVHLADADAWLDSLRNGSYWKKNGSSEPRERARPQPRNSRSNGRHKPSSANYSLPPSRRDTSRSTPSRRRDGAAYRTVCVRLCDGYYWPISFATTRDNLERDDNVCRQACTSPAMLYYHASPDGEAVDMVSIDGEPYTKLGNAFLYRTEYQASCKCKPHPWEKESTERHQGYADKVPADAPPEPPPK